MAIPKSRLAKRNALLNELRRESDAHAWSGYLPTTKGLLFDLARFAANSPARSIVWRDIRFPLRHSMWLAVCDPDTGKPLIMTQGGIL